MILTTESYDPATNLRQYPVSMARFRQNVYGENLYRIVYAPTRRHLAGDANGFRWVPTYRNLGEVWVLERWHSPEKFCQMTREQWERDMLILGPYPSRGEYSFVHAFLTPPADADLGKLITWIEEGQNRSTEEKRLANVAADAEVAKEKRDKIRGILDNAYPYLGANAYAGAASSRGTKHLPNLKSANELGLPAAGNFMTFSGKRKNANRSASISNRRGAGR